MSYPDSLFDVLKVESKKNSFLTHSTVNTVEVIHKVYGPDIDEHSVTYMRAATKIAEDARVFKSDVLRGAEVRYI